MLPIGLAKDHVIYVFIYLFDASNLFNFIYLKFISLTYLFLFVDMNLFSHVSVIFLYLPQALSSPSQ